MRSWSWSLRSRSPAASAIHPLADQALHECSPASGPMSEAGRETVQQARTRSTSRNSSPPPSSSVAHVKSGHDLDGFPTLENSVVQRTTLSVPRRRLPSIKLCRHSLNSTVRRLFCIFGENAGLTGASRVVGIVIGCLSVRAAQSEIENERDAEQTISRRFARCRLSLSVVWAFRRVVRDRRTRAEAEQTDISASRVVGCQLSVVWRSRRLVRDRDDAPGGTNRQR